MDYLVACCKDIHVPQRMHPNDLSDPLTFLFLVDIAQKLMFRLPWNWLNPDFSCPVPQFNHQIPKITPFILSCGENERSGTSKVTQLGMVSSPTHPTSHFQHQHITGSFFVCINTIKK